MAILDLFKKKEKNLPEEKKAEKKEVKKPAKKAEASVHAPKKPAGESFKYLAKPHVTEKATEFEKDNKYVFEVFKSANKKEVAKAIESLYSVNVESVNIINIPRKKRRTRSRREGWRKGYKKAIVKIQKGQKIEVMPR